MQEHLMIIFDKDSYFYIFETEDTFEYYNYLANVYREIEQYKRHMLNYIEYVITKDEVQKYMEENELMVKEIQKDLNLILNVPISDTMPLDRTFPKVPDYLLKQTSYLMLPIEIGSTELNNVPLFNHFTLSNESVEEIHKIIQQYCFSEKEYNEFKVSIAKGQKTSIAPHLISANTFLDTDYDVRFENHLRTKNEIKIKDSKYDDLYVAEKEGKAFVSKVLSVHFVGSFYEYRNFLYRNPSILGNIMKVITADLHKQTGHKDLEVRPMIDRFIILDNFDSVYSRLLDTIPNLGFFKDVDKVEFKLPAHISKVDPKTLKYLNGNIAISNFVAKDGSVEVSTSEKAKKGTVKKKPAVTPKKKTKPNLDIERMRKIHEKKFPNIPFMLDNQASKPPESETEEADTSEE